MTYRTIAARLLTAGVGVGAATGVLLSGSTPAQSPPGSAAWLRPAAPVLEPTARAAEPDSPTFNSYFPSASQPGKSTVPTSPWANVMMPPASPAPRPGGPMPPAKKDDSTMVGRAWNNLKDTFSDSPNPNVGTTTPPNPFAFQPARAGAGTPTPAGPGRTGPAANASPRIYTAPPAYRWYGWGTTTPGQNAYAPDGQTYPNGSSRWFVHTGATPGAFPSGGGPMPSRIVGGAEPPGYAGSPVTTFTGTRTLGSPPPRPNATSTVVPPPATGPAPSASPPATPLPTLPAPPVAPQPIPASRPIPAEPEPVWNDLSRPIPTVPVVPVPNTTGTESATPRSLPVPAADEPKWQPVQNPLPVPKVEVQPGPTVTVIPTAARAPAEPAKPGPLPTQSPAWTPVTPKANPAPAVAARPAAPAADVVGAGWQSAKTPLVAKAAPAAPGTLTPAAVNPPLSPIVPAAAPAPAAPVANPALHDDELLALERAVRDACRSSATVLEVYSTKPGKLTVRLIAQSDAMAEEAVRVISRMPQLVPYAVEFEGKVVGK